MIPAPGWTPGTPPMATVADIISRARFYVDDTAKVTDGWRTPEQWTALVNTELILLYGKWLRESMISLTWVDQAFTTSPFIFGDEPFAIIDVVEDLGAGNFRRILPAQSELGRAPFWDNTVTANSSMYWTMRVDLAGAYNLDLHPPVPGSYIVRYVPLPSLTGSFLLSEDMLDYVALRVALKALASEGGSSQTLERLVLRHEAEFKMKNFGMNQSDGAKVRIKRRPVWFSNLNPFTWNVNPYTWYFVR